MVLQYIYKPILNIVYEKITFKMSDRFRNIVIAVCFFIIAMVQFLNLYEDFGIFTSKVSTLCLWGALICIFFISTNSKVEIMRWNKAFYFSYASIAFILLITGISYGMGLIYITNAFMLVTVCIGIYYVWGNRRDFDVLFMLIAKAFVTFTAIVIFYGALRYPCFDLYLEAHSGGYTIMGINPNGFAKVLVPGVACSMYLLLKTESRNMRVVYSLMFGMSAYVLWMTHCRTGQLIATVILLYGMVFILHDDKRKNNVKQVGKKLITVLISIVVGIVLMGVLLNVVSPATAKYLSPNIIENTEKIIEKQKLEASIEQDETGDREKPEPGSYAYARYEGEVRVGDNSNIKQLNTVLTGRIYLWASYIDSLTWFGTSDGVEYKSPHNLYIDIAYKSGVIVGILWLLFCLAVGVISFSRSIMRKSIIYAFTFLTFIQFFFFAMLDTGTLFIDRTYIFVYYIALAPMFFIQNSSKKEVNK